MTIERWSMLAAVLLVAGCAGSGNTVPPVLREARERADDGHDAYAEGRLEDATLAYGTALESYRSIDDPVGVVRSLVNLAVVRNAAGAPDDAADCLDAIDRYVATLPAADLGGEMHELSAEAAWMRAFLHLENGRRSAAWDSLERGRALELSRGMSGRFDNLEARLRLEQGDASGALAAAERARAATEGAERADAHRLHGRAALASGQAVIARSSFESALEMDRRLARPDKVSADLEGLAEAAMLGGDPVAAEAFAERARLSRKAGQELAR